MYNCVLCGVRRNQLLYFIMRIELCIPWEFGKNKIFWILFGFLQSYFQKFKKWKLCRIFGILRSSWQYGLLDPNSDFVRRSLWLLRPREKQHYTFLIWAS